MVLNDNVVATFSIRNVFIYLHLELGEAMCGGFVQAFFGAENSCVPQLDTRWTRAARVH